MNYWDSIAAHSRIEEIWASHPAARARINRRVTGDPNVWPTTWLKERLAHLPRLRRTVSIGGGMGHLERDLVRLDLVDRVDGIEISPVCVTESIRAAAEAGMSERIAYRCADAWAELENLRDLDAIFFHASLHHFDRLDEMAKLISRALRPGGLLYLDEYVGPARDEWRLVDELRWEWHYYRLPRALRRVGRIRPPINYDDPTEAVASSQIVPAIRRHFDILEQRDYGGNLLSVIYANLHRPTPESQVLRVPLHNAVEKILDAEDRMLANGHASYHAVVLASPR
ncbi:MAG: class I SAM-dependent methyltransferase [Thermoanaerobaculia bacterium]